MARFEPCHPSSSGLSQAVMAALLIVPALSIGKDARGIGFNNFARAVAGDHQVITVGALGPHDTAVGEIMPLSIAATVGAMGRV